MRSAIVAVLFSILAIISAGPVFAGWRVAETAHFRIHSKASEARLRADAAILEDYHQLLVMLTNRPWPKDAPPLDIYFVNSLGETRIIAPKTGQYTAGFYWATDGGIVAIAQSLGNGEDAWTTGREVLLHEYAHHFMYQVGAAALPPWYVEGFAEYLMTAEFRPTKVEFGGFNNGRAYALSTMPWLPLETILTRAEKKDIQSFYAQSWLLAHYMFRVPEMAPKLKDYLRRVSSGEESVAAFRAAVSDDLPAFEKQLRAYRNGNKITFSRMTREPPAPADVKITELPPSADLMLLPLVSLQLPQQGETDKINFKRIQDQAARFAGDPWAMRALAIAEAIAGDPAVAASRLDAQLALTPDDPQLLRWRAGLHRPYRTDASQADISAARRLLARAFKAAPDDWLVLRDYAQTFRARGGKLPEDVLNVMVSANTLAPQVPGLAMMTGMALAEAGDYPLAYVVMAPFVFSPHGGRPQPELTALLSALRKGDAADVTVALKAVGTNSAQPESGAGPGEVRRNR